MSKHVIERYVSRDERGGACGSHSGKPETSSDHGMFLDPEHVFGESTCINDYGFAPYPGTFKKVRITVEEIPETPPKPRLCWFEYGGHVWRGYPVGKVYRVFNTDNHFGTYSHGLLTQNGVEIHWYDEEPANCE